MARYRSGTYSGMEFPEPTASAVFPGIRENLANHFLISLSLSCKGGRYPHRQSCRYGRHTFQPTRRTAQFDPHWNALHRFRRINQIFQTLNIIPQECNRKGLLKECTRSIIRLYWGIILVFMSSAGISVLVLYPRSSPNLHTQKCPVSL